MPADFGGLGLGDLELGLTAHRRFTGRLLLDIQGDALGLQRLPLSLERAKLLVELGFFGVQCLFTAGEVAGLLGEVGGAVTQLET